MALRLFIFLIGDFSEIPIKKISLSEVYLVQESLPYATVHVRSMRNYTLFYGKRSI